jgi:hypothetical protein
LVKWAFRATKSTSSLFVMTAQQNRAREKKSQVLGIF